jgi:hypothetical protein
MSKISKYYGGSQPHMRDTLITDDNVGPHTTSSTVKLKSGNVQKCTFTEADEGPVNLSPEKRIEQKYDRVIGSMEVSLTKDEMKENLQNHGIRNLRGTKKKLQDLCARNHLPVKKMIEKKIQGWIGKAKGSLQILYERGWIDEERLSEYTISGKKTNMVY